MSGIDVINYSQLQEAEALLYDIDSENQMGRFRYGVEQSARIGHGSEIDGVRDYVQGDDARMIDWRRTAQRSDKGLYVRQHYADQAPLTVLVSDIPTFERYAGTPGEPLSAQALGFVTIKTILETLSYDRSQVLGYWTNGTYDSTGKSTIIYSGLDIIKGPLINGLNSARISAESVITPKEESKKGLFGRSKNVAFDSDPTPEPEKFSQAITRAAQFALMSADVARYIIVSDFRDGTDDIIESLEVVRSYGNTEIITVQITNPLLRELPNSTEVFGGNNKKGIIVESQAQRDLYKQRAKVKQSKINNALRNLSMRTLTIDTLTPVVAVEA